MAEKEYEIIQEGSEEILKIDANGWPYAPSLEGNPMVMVKIIDYLSEFPAVVRIIINQKRNFNYNEKQTDLLREVAVFYGQVTKQKKLLSLGGLGYDIPGVSGKFQEIQYLVYNLLRSDPIGAYVEVKRLIRETGVRLRRLTGKEEIYSEKKYLGLLEYFRNSLGRTSLIKLVKNKLPGYVIGERELYKEIFRPTITPNFMLTRLMRRIPMGAEFVDGYSVGDNTVSILKIPDDIKLLYHVVPIELKISEDEYSLIDLARNVLAEHKPREEEFLEPARLRRTFYNIGKDLLLELAENKGLDIDYRRVRKLARILVRSTIGFGMIEVLLSDPKVQDITINSPVGKNPMFIVHADYGECVSNVVPSQEDAEGWATKFRLLSARPLDEANPVLDIDLEVPGARARVAAITGPLNPYGLAFALRRHREKPWTLPLFIRNKMISSLGAGVLSFMIDGARTMLIAGTRSSGKCVEGNTLIQMSDGRILKIKDLVGEKKKTIDDGVIFSPNDDYKVPSLRNFNLFDSKITDVWKRTSPEKVIKLKTRSGKELITTCEHPYFIYENRLRNIRADNLKPGDLIATPRNIDIKRDRQFIDLTKESYCKDVSEDLFILRGKTNSQTVMFPREVTPDLAEFIGLIIGDGHVNRTEVMFCNQCCELREKYKNLLKMLGVNYRVFKSGTTIVVRVHSRVLAKVLNKYFELPFGKKSDKVVIPQLILSSSNGVLAAFLRGYFDTDGYIPKMKRDIELATASEEMSKQLSMALLRFGIVGFSKAKIVNGVKYYRFLIRGSFVNKFGENIGFFHPMKKKRLDDIQSTDFLETTNVDTIPNGNEIISKLRKMLRLSPKDHGLSGKNCWAYENNEYRVTRNWFGKLIKFYKKRIEKLKNMGEQVNLLRFLNFDYNDYIHKIEKLRSLLGVSYVAMASDLRLNDANVRKILKNDRRSSYEIIGKLSNVRDVFRKRLKIYNESGTVEPAVKNLSSFVNNGVVTYAHISRKVNIPETTLKSYAYGGINTPPDAIKKIGTELRLIKECLVSNINESKNLLGEISLSLPSYVQLGVVLANFRTILNIKNEELVSESVCLQTVTNFFNGVYTCNFDVVQSIAKKIVQIYDFSISEEGLNLIEEAEGLASSDIFWDEVKSIEIIDRIDDFVYDLTVKDTHNFIANGLVAHNTSFLGGVLVEIMRKYRVIIIEDTLELPSEALRDLGYNIQNMKVRSALTVGGTEVSAEEGIRTSLRMGDSSLIIGEVRSKEAKALYEAMRIGALANVVAGTIHGDSPYGVFDRVVNDLGVPKTSFKATDVIVVTNPVKSADGLKSYRRVQSITEVRKNWVDDPLREKGFVELFKYDAKKDLLEPTDELINGESETLKRIAGNVREWAGSWDAVWENILLRSKIKKSIVDYSEMTNMSDLLEAGFVIQSNDMFHRISEEIKEELGSLDNKRIFFEWDNWVKREIKKRRFR